MFNHLTYLIGSQCVLAGNVDVVATRNEQEPEAPLKLQKLDPPVWRSQKPLLETAETEPSGLANRRVQFCRDQRQSGAPSGFDEVPPL
jgi:hypothetical protein